MPIAVPSNTAGVAVGPAKEKRYGTIAARIATQHSHELGIHTERARAGTVVHLIVQDVSRKPEEAKAAKWVCRHHRCAAKQWASKDELLAAHEENRLLRQKQETHLYVAVAEIPATPAVPEKKDAKTGEVIQEAREAKPARVMLLSDEE